MERVVHWTVQSPDPVPEWAVAQVAGAYKALGQEYWWQIRMLTPSRNENTELGWARAALIELICVRFAVLHQQYRASNWIFRSEHSLIDGWNNLTALISIYPVALPNLPLDHDYWSQLQQEGQAKWESAVKRAQRKNLAILSQAQTDLANTLAPLRTTQIVAWRFTVAEDSEYTVAWRYPDTRLRMLHLPLTRNSKTFVITSEELVTEEEMIGGLHQMKHELLLPVVAGWQQDDGRYMARGKGHRLIPSESVTPYRFGRPYLARRQGMPETGPDSPLSVGDQRYLLHVQSLSQAPENARTQELLRVQPIVLQTLEDEGIWEEYDRVSRAHETEEKKPGLGTVSPKGRQVLATAIFGGTSLILWDWARQERQRQGSLLNDMSMCPECGKQRPRERGQWHRKLCDDCASPGAKRVRRHRQRRANKANAETELPLPNQTERQTSGSRTC